MEGEMVAKREQVCKSPHQVQTYQTHRHTRGVSRRWWLAVFGGVGSVYGDCGLPNRSTSTQAETPIRHARRQIFTVGEAMCKEEL